MFRIPVTVSLEKMSYRRRRTQGRRRRNHTDQTANDSTDILVVGTEEGPACIDLTEDGDHDSFVDLTSSQGVNDASVIVLSPTTFEYSSRSRRRGSVRNTRLLPDVEDDLPPVPFPVESSSQPSLDSTSPTGTKINCPVCMDDHKEIKQTGRQLYSTTCGHVFCGQCIIEAISTMRSCPTCRQKLTRKQVHPLFI
ncbi:hypothetical protein CHS0354_041261 [Potamilus streckersoni]|uniref:RING-type domain-containing protein n=1 Tax=Potamilus streckersoni TaxID=2493646 RepID=A0AAE0VU48_9BIVA|nr:hypothetical protein CHS0354_041261 [Potamilus streckersoni]